MEQNDPQAIREDIEATRSRVGDTATDRTDAGKGAVSKAVDGARAAMSGATDTMRSGVTAAGSRVTDAVSSVSANLPSADDARAQIGSLGALAARNPLGLVIGSVAVGFLLGLMFPISDVERDQVGPFGERMAEKAREAASEAIEQGKSAVTDAVTTALSSTSSSRSSGSPASAGGA